ncbi:MAG TPA: hypothetical protein VGH46_05640 [Gaiellaceae bacterium]|jgi:hypothetical protein
MHSRQHGHGHSSRRSRPSFFSGGSFPSRRELLDRLESYQRDLEQQLADVTDVIAHLRDRDDGQQPAGA